MNSWPRTQIRYLARLGTGHTPSRSVDEYWVDCTIPWMTLADVGQLRSGTVMVVSETKEMISQLGVSNSSAVVHPAGTVAMSRTASVGYSCILGADMATSQDYVTWTCGPRLHPRFLLWVLRGEREAIIGRMQGSTHKTIYMPDIEQMSTPLPPEYDQQAIADYLDTETARIDTHITKKRRMLELLEERQVEEVRSLTSAGSTVPLRRVTEAVRTGTTPSSDFAWTITENGEIDWYTPGDFGAPLDVARSERRLRREAIKSAGVPQFPAGSVLVVGIGATAGKVGYSVDSCASNQQVTAICTNARVHPRFLAWQLRARRDELLATAPYTTLPILNNDFLRSLSVAVPQLDQQLAIVARLDAMERRTLDAINLLNMQADLLAEKRQALITAAVTGELEIPVAA